MLPPEEPSLKRDSHLTLNTQSFVKNEIDTRWTELKFLNTFSPRSYFAACNFAGYIYIHGGFNSEQGILKDFYSASLQEIPLSWVPINPKSPCSPGALRSHTLVSYTANLILVGGQINVVDNNKDIYRFNLAKQEWTVCKCLDLQGNNSFSLQLDSHSALVQKQFMYILNGYDAKSTYYSNKVLRFNLQAIETNTVTYEELKLGEIKPEPRANMSICFLESEIFLFGGCDLEQVFDDFWALNIETLKWRQIIDQPHPEKRKGHTLVAHEPSFCLFLFGGIRQITKERNDVFIYSLHKAKWIKIHSNTNEIYESSPTIKKMPQTSLALREEKKQRWKALRSNSFKLGTKTVGFERASVRAVDMTEVAKVTKYAETTGDFKKKMSVVQEKKYRQFINRKKRLLSNISETSANIKRSYSPTSQAIVFSINCMGEQAKNDKYFQQPKVIYDEAKGRVIGRKPCARDGHAALVHEGNLIIIGGDRHMVSFNDAFQFEMSKGIESLQLYDC